MQMFRGNVVSIHIARDAAAPMESTQEVKAIGGQGLEGDRYFDGTGHWSKTPGVSREVTLIELETIEEKRVLRLRLEQRGVTSLHGACR
jgi:hypothetical protein